MSFKNNCYVGLDNDLYGGMTSVGKIIRDAQVFGLLDEAETCEGWKLSRFDALLVQVDAEWDKYACMVSQLPDDLFQRHQKIHGEALTRAKAAGWSGQVETGPES